MIAAVGISDRRRIATVGIAYLVLLIAFSGCVTGEPRYLGEGHVSYATKDGYGILLHYSFVFSYRPAGVELTNELDKRSIEFRADIIRIEIDREVRRFLMMSRGEYELNEVAESTGALGTNQQVLSDLADHLESRVQFDGVEIVEVSILAKDL